MSFFLPYSWLILPAAAVSGGVLAAKISFIAAAFKNLAGERRYFCNLVAVSHDSGRNESSGYQNDARPFALALGFDYVNGYRSYSRSKRRRRAELWRAGDRETLTLVTSERVRWWTHHRTTFVSVLSNGSRVTTSDNFDDGDPLGLKGDMICRGLNFRELYAFHRSRLRHCRNGVEKIGHTNPLSVIEDLERSRVQQLADAGLARYRDEAQISWSYTFRGACDVYFRARPRQQREYHAFRAAQAESAK